MALRKIVLEDDPILLKPSRTVEKFDARLAQIIDDMKETLRDANGVGLAAVQVGILRRIVVVDTGDSILELVNPEIIDTKGLQEEEEGCLSLPGKTGITRRPMIVKIKAQDRNGKWQVFQRDGLFARCFCHELDHLDGVLFTSRIVRVADTAQGG